MDTEAIMKTLMSITAALTLLAADAGVRVTVTATPLLERLIGGERLGTEFEPNPDARR